MINQSTKILSKTTINNIDEPTIINYFNTINQEYFSETANLFSENGKLIAPFNQVIMGRNAIASYLKKEARGMKLLPQQGTAEINQENFHEIKIIGKVATSLFSVNVAWRFNLNSQHQIAEVKIKLLASPQELLGLQQKKKLKTQ